MLNSQGQLNCRIIVTLFITLICAVLCAPTLFNLINDPSKSDYYSHIIFIPFISAYLLYLRRNLIDREARYSIKLGLIIAVFGILLYCISIGIQGKASLTSQPSLLMISTIIIWVGGFLALYGNNVVKYMAFPIAFLLFMVPLPDRIMEAAIYVLRVGSTEAANWIFMNSGVNYHRTGFVFHFSNISIVVARECSGIRSFIALAVTGVLASYFGLRSAIFRCILVLLIIPVAMFKNGIRIAVLSLLGNYVDQRVLASDLHRKGGVLFFLIALIFVGVVIKLLQQIEIRCFSKQKLP